MRRYSGALHPGILPPGVPGVPYHPPWYPGTMGTRVHHHPVPRPLPAATAQHRRSSAGEPGPGLRARFRHAAMLSSRTTSPLVFPHLRSIGPGHPDRPQTIRGDCWIASRSRWAGAGQAQGAWLGGPEPSQGLLEALGPWIQGLLDPAGTPGSGPRTPGSRHPGQPCWPGSVTSWPVLSEV